MRWDGQITLRSSRIQVTMRWDGQITLRSLVFKWLWGGMGKLWGGMGKWHLEVSYSSDYEVGWANTEVSFSDYEVGWANHSRIQVTMRWDGQTTLRMRWDGLVFKWLWGGMGKPLLEVAYSRDLGGMGKLLFVFSYSSGYEVGSANHSQKSRIQVTIRWDGQINLRILVFKWKWVGMGKPLSGVSYSSDYEVGWANHT